MNRVRFATIPSTATVLLFVLQIVGNLLSEHVRFGRVFRVFGRAQAIHPVGQDAP